MYQQKRRRAKNSKSLKKWFKEIVFRESRLSVDKRMLDETYMPLQIWQYFCSTGSCVHVFDVGQSHGRRDQEVHKATAQLPLLHGHSGNMNPAFV